MNELYFLRDLVIILVASVIVVILFSRLKISAITGFIIAGVLVGPHGLALVNDRHQVELLSEIGVTLLLFGIGLELSFERIKRLWKPVLIGGFLQVGLTILLVFLIAGVMGLLPGTALAVGFMIALSSTAIVLRALEQRGEIDAPHGRLTLGILIFQDLCVVPMIMIIPILGESGDGWQSLAVIMLRAVVLVSVMLVISRLLIPKLMELVARTRQRHIFIMTALLICIGTAWASAAAGVSVALGAFLGGLAVAGSAYRHQVMADIIPFKEIFLSLFFVSIGMLFDPVLILENFMPIMLLVAAILVGKFLITFLSGLFMRLQLRIAAMAAASLAQIGEFSFVLLGAATVHGLIDDNLASDLLAATVITMFLTPLVMALAPSLAAGVGKIKILDTLMGISPAEEAIEKAARMNRHTIIGGYGLAGRDLATALKRCGLPYVIVELNPENIRRAHQNGEPAYYGDITSPDVLEKLDLPHADLFVIVINDPNAIRMAITAARKIAPDVYILVRTTYLNDVGFLTEAGASEVVANELISSIDITTRVLKRQKIDEESIKIHCAEISRLESQN